MPGDTYYSLYPAVKTGFRPTETFDVDQREDVESALSNTVTLDVEGHEDEEADGEPTEEDEAEIDIHLYGPGDIVGLDDDRIVRREPEPATHSHPPRQFPVVEFDRADLPWLFSPQRADKQGRTHPWLTLVVAEETHSDVSFEALGPAGLPVLEAPASELPPAADAWLWAHAQFVHDEDDILDDDGDKVRSEGEDYDGEGPAPIIPPEMETESIHTRSRIICPRNLEAQVEYRACLVPVFEPGRRAGLGMDPFPDEGDESESDEEGDEDEDEDEEGEHLVELAFAWGDGEARLPVYDTWEFSTSGQGDFLSLAKSLDPVVLGPEVGIRDVDVSEPGPETLTRADATRDSQTVGLEGALRSLKVESNGYDDPNDDFRTLLNRTLILEDELPEDVVAPPLYGRWYSCQDHLDEIDFDKIDDENTPDEPPWYEQCNLDPRFRMVAGFGTEVIQEHQEDLMAVAWEQFGDLRAFNRQQAVGELVRDSFEDHMQRIEKLPPGNVFGLGSIVLDDIVVPPELQTAIEDNLDLPENLDLGHGITCAGALELLDRPQELLDPKMQKLTGSTGAIARSSIDVRDNLTGLVTEFQRQDISQGWVTGEHGAWESEEFASDRGVGGRRGIDPGGDSGDAYDPTGESLGGHVSVPEDLVSEAEPFGDRATVGGDVETTGQPLGEAVFAARLDDSSEVDNRVP